MAGHSKWANTKHRKAAQDAKRGKIFTRIIKEISVAARIGGGDPDTNPRLRTAVATAKAANMPLDNVTRAIQKGTGELPGTSYDEVTYEGYGPSGTAIFLECLTDNKNRTVAEIRHLFSKYDGNLGENGCVAWMFDTKGFVRIAAEGLDEDEVMLNAADAGAEECELIDDSFEIYSEADQLDVLSKSLEELNYVIQESKLTRVPTTMATVDDEKKAESVLKFLDAIDNHDDVQNLYSNVDIPDEILDKLDG